MHDFFETSFDAFWFRLAGSDLYRAGALLQPRGSGLAHVGVSAGGDCLLLDVAGAGRVFFRQVAHGFRRYVEDDAFVTAPEQPSYHVGAHSSKSDHSQLHAAIPLMSWFSMAGPLGTNLMLLALFHSPDASNDARETPPLRFPVNET